MEILGAFPKSEKMEATQMTSKSYPANVLEQAQGILDAWGQIDTTATFGTLTKENFAAEIAQANQFLSQMNALEAQLTDMRNQRDAMNGELWDTVKRVRNGVKANYGDDSSQYEMVGGTRTSERKSPTRKTKA
jgi:hypothetical protein